MRDGARTAWRWVATRAARAWHAAEAYEPGPKARLASYGLLVLILFVISVRTQMIARENHQLAADNKARALRNCGRIETLKEYIRQTLAYDDEAMKVRLLRQGIVPASALGMALRTEAAKTSAKLQARFAAEPC